MSQNNLLNTLLCLCCVDVCVENVYRMRPAGGGAATRSGGLCNSPMLPGTGFVTRAQLLNTQTFSVFCWGSSKDRASEPVVRGLERSR